MRYLTLILIPFAAGAQQSTSTTFDINGRPIAGSSVTESRSGSELRRSERVRTLNGREVPIESLEERLVSDSNGVKVIERVVRRYDANGNPGPAEKTVIEETTTSEGSTTKATTYRGDINGGMQVAERSTTERRRSGSGEESTTAIERQSVNGGFEVQEKRNAVVRTSGSETQEEVTTLRRSETGRFYEAARQVSERATRDGAATENVAIYQSQDGRLQLTGQRVSRTTTGPDGSSVSEVNVYSSDIAGRPGGQPQLREQQLIERRSDGDAVVESISVRRPTVDDPNKLGRFQKVEERVCNGCGKTPQPEAASGPAAPEQTPAAAPAQP